jgi:hypothetical protein
MLKKAGKHARLVPARRKLATVDKILSTQFKIPDKFIFGVYRVRISVFGRVISKPIH